MSKLLSEEIVEAVTLGDKEGFMSAFQSALAAKVSDALEIKKVEIASTLVTPASNEVVEEEVEQLDELKKSTLGKYIKKSAEDKAERQSYGDYPDGSRDFDDNERRLNSRTKGIGKAVDKLTKEEIEHLEEDAEAMVAKLKAKHKDHNFYVKNGRVVHTYYSDAKVKKLQKELSEEVEQIDEAAKPAAKELKVSFGSAHSGRPGGDDESDAVTTHHGNGVKVTSAIGWDGDHHIDVHHNGKHVGGIFSTHGGVPEYTKNEKYKGGIGHKEVKAAMNAHQKHPEVQSWLIHNHPDSESEAESGTINGHKLHPTAKKYLEKISNDNDRDYEAPYKPQTSSAVKPKPASKASTSSAYEKALAALKKKHGISEEVEQVEEGLVGTLVRAYVSPKAQSLVGRGIKKVAGKLGASQQTQRRLQKAGMQWAKNKIGEEAEQVEEAKGESRISWRSRTPEEIAKSDKRRKVKITSAELEARARARRAEAEKSK